MVNVDVDIAGKGALGLSLGFVLARDSHKVAVLGCPQRPEWLDECGAASRNSVASRCADGTVVILSTVGVRGIDDVNYEAIRGAVIPPEILAAPRASARLRKILHAYYWDQPRPDAAVATVSQAGR